MRLLHGRPLAERLEERARDRSAALSARGIAPRLAAVSVGTDPAVNTYLQRLAVRGRRVSVTVDETALPREADEHDVVAVLDGLGRDPLVHGILLLTPLPATLEAAHLADRIDVAKDVEGMNAFNVGLLTEGRPRFIPSTAEAVIELLGFHEIDVEGKHAVIVGRSPVIGRPLAALLLARHATVTVAHSRTSDLGSVTKHADVLIVGVGRAKLVRGDMIKNGAIVIDAGINVTPAGIVGDVDADSVSAVAAALSPVPGGLGSVTTELLLRNVIRAAEELTAD